MASPKKAGLIRVLHVDDDPSMLEVSARQNLIPSARERASAHMEKSKFTALLFRSIKVITLCLCVLLVFSPEITPLSAQLNPARDLTGTWQSSATGMYYELDPSDPTTRMDDVTATFAMDITQQGSQITIILYLNPISYTTDSAYWNEYGFGGVPPVGGGAIEFVGTVSSSSFTADEQGSQLGQEHLVGTFTTDIITATLSGDFETTDANGIVVTRTSSPTASPFPTYNFPTSSPSASPTQFQPTADNLGSVSLVRGSAWFTNTGTDKPITSQSQIGTGTEIRTGSETIVGFSYPDQGGEVYLGQNTVAGWIYVQQETASDGQPTFKVVPPSPTYVPFEEEGGESGMGPLFLVTLPIEVAVGVLVFGHALPAAIVGAIIVEGVLLLPEGIAYIRERVSQDGTYAARPVITPQGEFEGANTEYVVNVSSAGTVVQVIDGPVLYIDPITNNTITVQTNEKLTLSSGAQNGFSQQELQSSISTFDPASVDQWWTQTTPDTSNGLLDQPIILVVLVVAIALVIAACVVTVAKRKKREFAQPGVKQPSGTYLGKPMSKKRLIAEAIFGLVFLSVVGYFIITVLNSGIAIEYVGMDVSFYTFMEAMIITVLAIGYLVGLVQQIRRYRGQESRPLPPPSTTTGEISGPMYKMASGLFAEPVSQPSTLACPNCGNQLTKTKNFCPYCGFQLKPQDS